MEGTFAKVYKGTVLERDGSEEKVVVKTVIGKSVKFLVIHNTAQLLCGILFENRNDSHSHHHPTLLQLKKYICKTNMCFLLTYCIPVLFTFHPEKTFIPHKSKE